MSKNSNPAKQKKLTPEQLARAPGWVDKWIQIGLSTAPADFEQAEIAVRGCYSVAGLAAPKVFHAGSPLDAARLINRKNKYRDHQNDAFARRDHQNDAFARIESAVDVNVQRAASLELAALNEEIYNNIWQPTENRVNNVLWQHVTGALQEAGPHTIPPQRSGAFWAAWYAQVSYLRDVLGWRHESLAAYAHDEMLGKTCGMVLVTETACAISTRPRVLRIDPEGRPHCETGPAVEYPDGWKMHVWRGVTMPAQWIEHPEKFSAQDALEMRDVEQRRTACEILGWSKIIRECNGRTVDKDDDPEIGELVEVTLPRGGQQRFLRVQCGTGREFALPVPDNVETALQANAWTYGFDADNFVRPEIRT